MKLKQTLLLLLLLLTINLYGQVHYYDFGSPDNIGKNINDEFIIDNSFGNSIITFHCVPPVGGTIQFLLTFDGINYESMSFRSTTTDLFSSKSFIDENYIGSVAGARKIKIITIVPGSSNGTIMGRLQKEVAVIEAIEFGNPPHRFGYEPIHKDISFTTTQTNTPIWIPDVNKKFIVTDIIITATGATYAIISIYDHTDVSGNRLYRGNVVTGGTNPVYIFYSFKTPFVSDAVNNILRITTTAAIDLDIIVHGYEI